MEPAPPASRRDAVTLSLAAFFAALLVRLPSLWTDPLWGTTEQHEFGLFPAHLVGDGLLGPMGIYLPQAHQGCTILFGLGCAPLMQWLGPTVGAARVCSVLLHCLLAAVIALLALQARGRVAGLAAAILAAVGTPALLHFATKGSTNHDDATLLVGASLALVAALRAPGWRQLLPCVLAGAIGGLAVIYYLDALFALLGVAAVLLLGPSRLPRVLGYGLGFAGGYLAGVPMGVDLWGSGAVQVAVETGTLGDAVIPATLERLALLGSEGLESALGPWRSLELGSLSLDPGRWGTAAHLLGLAVMALCGPLLRRRSGEALPLPARRVLWGALLALGLGFAAVLGSGVDITYGGYTSPLWTYAVVLAAAGWPGAGPAKRIYLGAFALALLPALPAALEPAQQAVWEEIDPAELHLARTLRVDRLADHAVSARTLLWEEPEQVAARIPDRPRDRGALARVLGRQVGLHLWYASWFPTEAPSVAPRLRRWWGQGVGEGVVLRLQREATDGRGVDKLIAILAGIRGFGLPETAPDPDSLPAAVLQGMLLDTLHYASGRLTECEVVLAIPALRREGCVAAGRWAYLGRRQEELAAWNEKRRLCDDAEIGWGYGVEVAREVEPWDDPPVARLQWLWPEASLRAEDGFQAGYQEELRRVQGVRGADWQAPPVTPEP